MQSRRKLSKVLYTLLMMLMLIVMTASLCFGSSLKVRAAEASGHSSWYTWLFGGDDDDGQSGQRYEDEDLQTEDIEEDGTYTSKEAVAAYLHLYGHLPDNFITKKEAKKLGWDASAGNLDEVAPGMSIGGDYFGNYEGLLPEAKGRSYYECDIDYEGGYRGASRIIYSDDGLIYYTEDHYKTFEQLYDAEGSVSQ